MATHTAARRYPLPTQAELVRFHNAARELADKLAYNASAFKALDTLLNTPPSSLEVLNKKRVVASSAATRVTKFGEVQILLGRRSPGYSYAGNWELFGGKVETFDSTIRMGLERELMEETGLHIARVKGPVYDIDSQCTDQSATAAPFVSLRCWVELDGADSRPNLSKEHDDHGWFSLDEVDTLQISNGMRSSIYTALYLAMNEAQPQDSSQESWDSSQELSPVA